MFFRKTEYGRVFRWMMTSSASVCLCGCALLSGVFHPTVEEEAVVAFDEESVAYYDSVQMAEEALWQDSCVDVIEPSFDVELVSDSLCFSDLLADSIIAYAMQFLGAPYKMGATGPEKFDCSGFTSYVFRHFGIVLSRTTLGQIDDGEVVMDPKELQRGDLVFFGGRRKPRQLGHVAIVIDNHGSYFTFIHSTIKLGVTISKSTESYYKPRYLTACRILPES